MQTISATMAWIISYAATCCRGCSGANGGLAFGMPKFKGTILRSDLEGGYYTLETEKGDVYKLDDLPKELQKSGITVEIEGKIDGDAMGIGFGAPVLKVKKHKILK